VARISHLVSADRFRPAASCQSAECTGEFMREWGRIV